MIKSACPTDREGFHSREMKISGLFGRCGFFVVVDGGGTISQVLSCLRKLESPPLKVFVPMCHNIQEALTSLFPVLCPKLGLQEMCWPVSENRVNKLGTCHMDGSLSIECRYVSDVYSTLPIDPRTSPLLQPSFGPNSV